DWVSKLPAIEFALNCAQSETTGYAPFMLNTGCIPRSMIWNSNMKNKYPSVQTFAWLRRLAIMSAHDAILEARVKQTHIANQKQCFEPFHEGALVYV
ncbi:hypothetical protein ARMGADRAFT_876831, partial [Armillaria gallica]